MSYIHSQLTGASGILALSIGASGQAAVNYTDTRAAASGLSGVNYTDARAAATGLAGVNYTDARVAVTGQQAWLGVVSVGVSLSGSLASTGQQAWLGAMSVGTNLSGNLASTGGQAWNAANNNGINTSGSLLAVSGVLAGQISAAAVGVSTLNGLSGVAFIGGTRGNSITPSGQTLWISGDSDALVASGGLLIARDLETSGVLNAKIQASAAGVSTLNTLSGTVVLGAAGTNIALSTSGSSTIWISGNGIAQATDLVSTGGLLITRDTEISGGLEWRIFLTGAAGVTYTDTRAAATGLAGVNYTNTQITATLVTVAATGAAAGVYTDTRVAASGLAGVNYTDVRAAATGLAGVNYTNTQITTTLATVAATGLASVNYTDTRAAASGLAGVNYTDVRVAASGQAAWLALNGGDINLSGNMTTTGNTVWTRINDVSGGLQSQINGITPNQRLAILSVTGNFNITGNGTYGYSWSGNLQAEYTGILPPAGTMSGYQVVLKNRCTGAYLLISGDIDYGINYTLGPKAAIRIWSDNATFLII